MIVKLSYILKFVNKRMKMQEIFVKNDCPPMILSADSHFYFKSINLILVVWKPEILQHFGISTPVCTADREAAADQHAV